jgi:hypothetical protein
LQEPTRRGKQDDGGNVLHPLKLCSNGAGAPVFQKLIPVRHRTVVPRTQLSGKQSVLARAKNADQRKEMIVSSRAMMRSSPARVNALTLRLAVRFKTKWPGVCPAMTADILGLDLNAV